MAGIYLKIRVTPKSSKNSVIGWENETLKLKIAAVPEKGAANKETIKFLSEILDIPKSKIEITAGESSRNKTVHLEGISLDQVKEKIK